jgi:hypothetical protein
MERDNAPMDDKLSHNIAMKETFGDDFKVVNCEKVENNSGDTLFCEMLVKTEAEPIRKNCPDGTSIVMEVFNDM